MKVTILNEFTKSKVHHFALLVEVERTDIFLVVSFEPGQGSGGFTKGRPNDPTIPASIEIDRIYYGGEGGEKEENTLEATRTEDWLFSYVPRVELERAILAKIAKYEVGEED